MNVPYYLTLTDSEMHHTKVPKVPRKHPNPQNSSEVETPGAVSTKNQEHVANTPRIIANIVLLMIDCN